MCPLCTFFNRHVIEIYFLYGLAFFITGIAVWLEASRTSTLPMAQTLPFLAAFGLVHGAHEWVQMFQKVRPELLTVDVQLFRLALLALSFIALAEFGLQLLTLELQPERRRRWRQTRWLILAVFLAGATVIWRQWGQAPDAFIAAVDAWCRYSLAVPGAVLAAVGLCRHSHCLSGPNAIFSHDLRIVGLAFLLYGIPGQLFATPSPLPPSTSINTNLFMSLFHLPVQLLRTGLAGLTAVFTVRALRLFNLERQQRIQTLNRRRLEAQQQLTEEVKEREALQRKLFHRVVQAQEEERRHIARELHDEAGQALTALSFELAAVAETIPDGSTEVRHQIEHLQGLTQDVMEDLHALTTRLRPLMLDELGLIPALITYADECSTRYPFTVEVVVDGERQRLPSEIETTLYRITQEALTNTAKHAHAEHASVRLCFTDDEVMLHIADDGHGMDVEAAREAAARGEGWGLAGIAERIQLVDGHLDLHATPGEGTFIGARVPIPSEPHPTRKDEP